jgi:hypothetical protein
LDHVDESIHNFLVDPQNSSTLYIDWGGIGKSLDGGMTWTELNRVALVAIDNFSTLYARRGTNLIKSVDGGVTFTDTSFNRNFISFGIDPNNPSVIYATTSVNAFYGPKIEKISVDGKNLVITASDVHEGAIVWVNSDAQITKVSFQQSLATLTAKKAYKRIRPGQTVSVRIIDSDGYVSDGVSFTRSE